MAYKISGNATDDCKIYVINSSSDLIDKVESVSAGAYEVGLLTASNVNVMAVSNGGAVAYSNVDTIYYSYVQPTFGLSLKEVKRDNWDSGTNFYIEAGPSLKGYSGDSREGYANAFCVFHKDVLDGNKIVLDWSVDVGSADYGMFTVDIVDGTFDRTNASDWPFGERWATKGNGQLIELYSATRWSDLARTTLNSTILDLSSATLDYVTVFITVGTDYGKYASYSIYGLKVLSPSNAVITQVDMSATLAWPEGGIPTNNYQYGSFGTIATVEEQ